MGRPEPEPRTQDNLPSSLMAHQLHHESMLHEAEPNKVYWNCLNVKVWLGRSIFCDVCVLGGQGATYETPLSVLWLPPFRLPPLYAHCTCMDGGSLLQVPQRPHLSWYPQHLAQPLAELAFNKYLLSGWSDACGNQPLHSLFTAV